MNINNTVRRVLKLGTLACIMVGILCLFAWLWDHKKSTLVRAVTENDVGKVETLLQTGANVDSSTLDGTTPLMAAAGTCNLRLVKLLLARGADPNISDLKSRTAIDLVATLGRTDTADQVFVELLSSGTIVDPNSPRAVELLGEAAMHGELGALRSLLEMGVGIDRRDQRGRTAFMLAAREGQRRAVVFLAQNGAVLDAQDSNGLTALMYAAYNGEGDVVLALKFLGANLEIKDKDGFTAVNYANDQKHADIADFLSHSPFEY